MCVCARVETWRGSGLRRRGVYGRSRSRRGKLVIVGLCMGWAGLAGGQGGGSWLAHIGVGHGVHRHG